jgi:hypothetical protein
VHDLLPGQNVIIRGLGGDGMGFPLGPASEGLIVARCDGHVRMPRWELVPGHLGVFLVDNGLVPNVLFPVGTTGATGVLDVSIPVPELGPGIESAPVHLQGIFREAGGKLLLAPASNALLLDAAF